MDRNNTPYSRSGTGSEFSGVSLGSTPPTGGPTPGAVLGAGQESTEGPMSEEDAERLGLLSGHTVQVVGIKGSTPRGQHCIHVQSSARVAVDD